MFKKKNKSGLSESDLVYLQNSVKTLAANIRFSSVDNPLRVIGVTSSVPNEGKTTVSYMLGQAMASGGGDVLLVNCDFRHRSLAKKARVHSKKGLYAVLAGRCELSEAVVPLDIPGLYLLDVEPSIPSPVDVLASRRFHELMLRVRNEYGFVIVDTPPLSAFVDAAVVSRNADGMLLVVREGFTKREDLLAAYDQLLKADANVIGTVLNFCNTERSSHYYYYNYYTTDGKKVRGGSSRRRKRAQEAAEDAAPAMRWDVYIGDEAGKTNVMAPLPESAPAAGELPEDDSAPMTSSPSATGASSPVGDRVPDLVADEPAEFEPLADEPEPAPEPEPVLGLEPVGGAKPKAKNKPKDKEKGKSKGKDKQAAKGAAAKAAAAKGAEPKPAKPAARERVSIDDTAAFLALVGYSANTTPRQ
ncbi:MAG: CpsD/CapB family tyrosine-protein kinase [Coriobacteriia bacterium]|nr:CpsD/CapB family tyrosine-protein kinase [Coriobacteriia bacterium]